MDPGADRPWRELPEVSMVAWIDDASCVPEYSDAQPMFGALIEPMKGSMPLSIRPLRQPSGTTKTPIGVVTVPGSVPQATPRVEERVATFSSHPPSMAIWRRTAGRFGLARHRRPQDCWGESRW